MIDHVGEIIALKITLRNTNDRTPILELCKHFYEKTYTGKGYIRKKLN
ncbi:hypothetical protein CXF79_03935 [Colwellia sp. Bg11-28]|nr:hypothetical protein CXF79_03935 [Colwellia sp. Bg11-28]